MLDVKFELKGVKEAKDLVDPKRFKQAIRSTLDKTGTFAKKQIVEEVTKEYNVKAKDVRAAIQVQRTSMTSMEVWLKIKSAWLSLLSFGAKQGPRGVTATIERSRSTFYRGFFKQTMPTGHEDIYRRKIYPWPSGIGRGKKGKFKGVDPARKEKMAIRLRPGPSIPLMVQKASVYLKIREKVTAHMQGLFKSEIEKRRGLNG